MITNKRTMILLILVFSITFISMISATDSAKTIVKTKVTKMEMTIKPEDNKIENFEKDVSLYKLGWIGVTDTMMQGNSTCDYKIVDGGANKTAKSLLMTGVVKSANPYVMFSGVSMRFQRNEVIYDVTDYLGISFFAKGDGNTYRIDLPCAAVKDYMFHSFAFTPPKGEWKEYKIPFKGFKQIPYGAKVAWSGKDVQGVQFFTVGGPLEKFELQIDELEFFKAEKK